MLLTCPSKQKLYCAKGRGTFRTLSISMVEIFVKIVNYFLLLTVFVKRLHYWSKFHDMADSRNAQRSYFYPKRCAWVILSILNTLWTVIVWAHTISLKLTWMTTQTSLILILNTFTTQKMKFSIKDFIFCAVIFAGKFSLLASHTL